VTQNIVPLRLPPTLPRIYCARVNDPRSGGVAEWLKAHAWKACIRATVSRVRIPLPPPARFRPHFSGRRESAKKRLCHRFLRPGLCTGISTGVPALAFSGGPVLQSSVLPFLVQRFVRAAAQQLPGLPDSAKFEVLSLKRVKLISVTRGEGSRHFGLNPDIPACRIRYELGSVRGDGPAA
jgi:hypothetical protein